MLLGCTVLYLFLMNTLQRDASLRSYLLQDYSETSNIFQSWLVIGVINVILLAALVSQYIPVIPRSISNIQVFGLELNKMGFSILAISLFYLIRSTVSFLFFQSLGFGRRWNVFCYASSKFYLIITLLLVVLNFTNYFFGIDIEGNFYMIDPRNALKFYLSFAVIVLLFKNIYYLFNKNEILPFQWYYKILYICTLQIAPVLALWKLLFI